MVYVLHVLIVHRTRTIRTSKVRQGLVFGQLAPWGQAPGVQARRLPAVGPVPSSSSRAIRPPYRPPRPGKPPLSRQPYSTRARGAHRIAGHVVASPGPPFRGPRTVRARRSALLHGYRGPKRDSSTQSRNVDCGPTGRRAADQSVSHFEPAEAPDACFGRRAPGTRYAGRGMPHAS